MVFNTGIFLNMFDKNPSPLISLTEKNFDFIFFTNIYKYFTNLDKTYGLSFFDNLPIGLISLVCFLQDRQNITYI